MKQQKHWFFFLLLTLAALATGAQDTALLRLRQQPNDTAKVARLLAFGKPLVKKDAEKARAVFNEARVLAESLQDNNGVARALVNLGYIDLFSGNYPACIEEYHAAIVLFRKMGNTKEMCNAQLDLSAGFSTSGQRDSAFFYCMKALKVLETQPFLRERTRAYLNLGTQYNNMQAYDKAIAFQKKALELAKETKDSAMLQNVYSALSLAYDNKNEKQQAFAMIHLALPLLTPTGNKVAACRIYNQYAYACIGVGNLDEAITTAKKAIALASEIHDVNHLGTSTLTLAEAYAKKGDYRKTIAVIHELEQTSDAAYRSAPDEVYSLLAEAYSGTGDFKKSAEAYRNLLAVKDSLFSSETARMVTEQEVSYKTAQRDKALSQNKLQLAQKDLQLQKNRNYMYYTVAALMVSLLLVALLVIQYRHRRRLHQNELQAVSQQREIELLQALMQGEEKERSRIARDLHDGVAGMLAAVKMHLSSVPEADQLLHTEGYRQGMALLNEAAQEIRKTSHNLMPEVLLQHGLDEALRRYCSSVSNHRRLFIQYDSWGVIDRFTGGFELSVYRIVQELIANMLKHSRATQAVVQLSQQEALLCLSIEDNGVGFAAQSTATGMGLHSLHSRIRALNGKLELHTSEQNGVSAYLEFETTPLKKQPTTAVYE